MSEMSLIEQLLAVAEAYRVAENVPLTTVSSRAFSDAKKLGQLKDEGRDINSRRFEGTMQWFSDNWPRGARWPKGVPRPAAEAQCA